MNLAPRRQSGSTLWILLIGLAMSGAYAWQLTAKSLSSPAARQTRLAATLARAKEALIARAVNDDNRPGSLPCPDLITDNDALSNHPGDGRADMLAGNNCPSYLGWLPWITLDLPELSDEDGNHLWYALSANRRDDDSAQPINSDTTGDITLDGNADIAALIIAPGPPLDGQHRPSRNPADYLESSKASATVFVSRPAGAGFNDQILSITRQELMAAVEKRVASEVHNCLERHTSAQPEQRYPWPAPFASAQFEGKAGSLFGRIPLTQPGSGPEDALVNTLMQLQAASAQLGQANDANQQLAALGTLDENLIQARNLFASLYDAASKLKQSAAATELLLNETTSTVDDAIANGRISRSEGSAIRDLAARDGAALAPLPDLLSQNGIDVFPWELARRSRALSAGGDVAQLAAAAQSLQELLAATNTPRNDIAPALTLTLKTATATVTAALAAKADATQLADARNTASALQSDINTLQNAITNSRINILSAQVSDYAAQLDSLAGDTTQLATEKMLRGVESRIPNVVAAKTSALNALASHAEAGLISEKIRALAATIAQNEAVDNNLSHSSLATAIAVFGNAQSRFVEQDTAAVRPLQSDIVPYANAVGETAASLDLWTRAIADNGTQIATLAKTDAATDNSAYGASVAVLDSISDKKGSAELLRAYISKPTPDNQANASQALAATTARLNTLIARGTMLKNQINGTTASAQAIVWSSRQCDFLLPQQTSWWNDNRWMDRVFYQISHPFRAAPPGLNVNGQGQYRLVVLAAGGILTGQRRGTASVADFLEGANAAPSRNGNATNPANTFSADPVSVNFNDRLAF